MDISKEYKPIFDFIEANKEKNPYQMRLENASKHAAFDIDFAITQIECRKKYKSKLKEYIDNSFFLFPDALSGEQASHGSVARFHSSLTDNATTLLDMTSGLGIDSMEFAKKGLHVTAIDIEPGRSSILSHNATNLGLENIHVINEDSMEFLKNTDRKFDIIFVDPSRRGENSRRVYGLKDCVPDVYQNIELLKRKANKILIKASPMLDISQTLRDFSEISALRVIGVKGECKEVLIEIIPSISVSYPLIEALNLDTEGNIISSFTNDPSLIRQTNPISYLKSDDIREGLYLLEPSAMVMKTAPWQKICEQFSAKKFSESSHLFLTDTYPDDFPGRISFIKKIITKKDRKSLVGLPAVCISRNYPLSSDSLRKELKLKEGEDNFIYASKIGNKPLIIHSIPVQNLKPAESTI